ncbi:MAG TPA: sulfotransferase [Ktedonobacterales bacterium]|nr:sulfotransferase [Ktedonobacterales bacterium]
MTQPRRQVFIGGSSQSGTTTLNRFLWLHPDVLACGLETCFVVGPHGLMDVVRGISDEYCYFRLDSILYEFDRLMHHHLCSPRSYPYNRFDLASFFGRKRYHAAIDKFFARIGASRYNADGLTIQSAVRVGGLHTPYKLKRLRLPARLARERSYLYRADRQSRHDALAAGYALLEDLFGAKAREEGKRVWCEQTSTNQLFARFLIDLCPDGLHINTIRDPLDVALAHQAQDWMPDDFVTICATLRSVYDRWFTQRDSLPVSSYIEIHFEELVSQPERVLPEVCAAIGISYDARMLESQPDARRLAAERERRNSADLATYRRILGPTAERLGYTVP